MTAPPGVDNVDARCQMNSEIQRVMLTASNSCLKQSCSALASVTGALEVNLSLCAV